MTTHYNYDEQFLEIDFKLAPSCIFEWIPEEKVRNNLKADLINDTASMHDDIFAHGFKRLCPVPDTQTDDYKYQVLELNDGRKIMTSIRFKGLNILHPFVEILHYNFEPNFKKDLPIIKSAVLHKYADFKPRSIRIFTGTDLYTELDNSDNINCDYRFFAAKISYIKSLPQPKNYNKVALEPARDLKIYSQYLELYGQLYRENPHLIHVIVSESRENFEKVRNAGTLFNIYVQDKWAGIVGVTKRTEKFLHGYKMFDIIISKSYRQKGFTHAIQRKLFDILDHEHHETIYGEINPLNNKVISTAHKVGGLDLGGWYFITLT